jgi:hypothetical protein
VTDRRKQSTANGSDIVNRVDNVNAPMPDRLHELERRISAALTGDATSSALAELLAETDAILPQAEQHAKAERERGYDPALSPDLAEARRRSEDAQFALGRLQTLRPRVLQKYREAISIEEVRGYRAKLAALQPERDRLQAEFNSTYRAAVEQIIDLFVRIKSFQQRMRQELGDPPSGVDVLSGLDERRVLERVVLPDPSNPERTIWPPPSSFASDFAMSMTQGHVGGHAGADWWKENQQRAIDRRAEAERMNAHIVEAKEQQELRMNREEKERFQARTDHHRA